MSWSSASVWAFDKSIYISWLPGILNGAASYNYVEWTQSPVTIPIGSAAYVILDINIEGAYLNVVVSAISDVPVGLSTYTLATNNNNSLQLSSGIIMEVDTIYNSSDILE
jgi:hypothetical protein